MKKQILTAITLLGVCMHSHALILQTKVVQGEISGVEHNGAALYKHIPYAELDHAITDGYDLVEHE